MKAIELQQYLQSLSGNWTYPENTVDTFKSGNPDAEITGVVVAWMSYTSALEQAVALGCNVFITHEPTYYNHFDTDPAIRRSEAVQAKQQYIRDNNLIIIRCHDLWDQYPRLGIPDSWGKLLDWHNPTIRTEHFRIYDQDFGSALDVAQHVAQRTQPYGQQAVQLIGEPQKPIKRICIGTGAITPFIDWVKDFDIDLGICTDDGINYWRDGAFAIDMNLAVVVVNHPVSEVIGVQALYEHLQEQFPAIQFHHLQQACMYQLISHTGSIS